jgi:uncharacterized Zn finger protein
MKTQQNLKCPQCGCSELDCRELGIKGSRWAVTFGREPFKKEKLLAYACGECGFVFLQLLKMAERK